MINRLNVPYTYPPINFLTLKDYITNLVNLNGGVYWPLDDVANNPYNRVINPVVAKGRNIVLNGDFSSSSTWALGNASSTITGGNLHNDGTNVAIANTTQTLPLTVGRAYEVTFDLAHVTGSGVRINFGTTQGTTRLTNGTFTETLIASSTNFIISFFIGATGDIDNITVKELNIPASDAVPVQLLNTDVWNGLGTADYTAVGATLSAQTVTRHDGNSGTVLQIVRNATAPNYATASVVLIVGQVYRAYGWALSTGTGIPVFYNGTTALKAVSANTGGITSWQLIDVSFVATATDFRLGNSSNTAGSTVQFDTVTLSLDTFISPETNLLQDGDQEKAAANTSWAVANGGVLSKQAGAHDGSLCLRVGSNGVSVGDAQQVGVLVTGRRYWISGWYRGDGGTGSPSIASVTATILLSGITTNTWTFFSVVFTAADSTFKLRNNTSTNGTYAEFDTVRLVELSPLVALPVNGVVLENVESSRLLVSETLDGINDVTNVYSSQLNSIWNPASLTVEFFFHATNASFWTDGATHFLFSIQGASSLDQILISKTATNNNLNFLWRGTNIAKSFNILLTSPGTNWHHVAITVSIANDQLIGYADGVQVGIQTGLTPWTPAGNNLAAANSTLGAAINTGASFPSAISIAHPAIIPSALPIDYIAEMAKLGDTV